MTRPALVLCIGNPSRGDDGAGARVASLLADRLPGQRVEAVHQLDVALAADVAAARLVVFVDAERRDGDVTVRDLAPEPGSGSSTHLVGPAALLALAAAVYGAAPPAMLVSVPAGAMPHAERLTAATATACERAADLVADLVARA